MTLQQIKELEAQHVLHTYDRYPVLLTGGKGVHVIDDEGNEYLDFLSGIGVNALGYAHPAVERAISEQARKGAVHFSNLFHNEYHAPLAARLCKISGFDKVFLANTGTEAWEGALKFARLYARAKKSNKTKVLAMENSFHGRSMGSLSTTGQAKYREPFAPLVPEIDFVRFNDVDHLRERFDESVVAVCFETIQGEGGIVPVSREFIAAARELTKKSGALLILDEIQCGLGRTGKWFAYQHYDIQPDIVTIAKPIAGGVPLAAVLMTDEVAACVSLGLHGTTFGGGPLACAAALAVLDTIEHDHLLSHAKELGDHIAQRLHALAEKIECIREVRVFGLMIGIEIDHPEIAKRTVTRMLQERRILINRTHETVLRMLPPYIIEREHADTMLNAIGQILTEESQAMACTPGAKGEKVG